MKAIVLSFDKQSGLVELTWLDGATSEDLQNAMRRSEWHVFHFIGHGGYDAGERRGYL